MDIASGNQASNLKPELLQSMAASIICAIRNLLLPPRLIATRAAMIARATFCAALLGLIDKR